MAATRFPGKPLVPLGGRPVVQWVYDAAVESGVFDEVVVATDSPQIFDFVERIGGRVEMTREDHETGSDRVAEVAVRHPEVEVFVNVQGDQPFVTSDMLQALVAPYLAGEQPVMTTLGAPLQKSSIVDPNTVKVVCDRNGDALYFSRSPIPYFRTEGDAPVLHHLGLYAFLRRFLLDYADLSPTPLEQREGLEQLRVLEHGYRIRVCHTSKSVLEINTPEDLAAAEALLRQ
jgi:3-deoxy-manno-octulosonate cytidylyltransferase (CMP-KDO synthetase)